MKTSTEYFASNGKTFTLITDKDESGEIILQVCSEDHDEAIKLYNIVKNK